MNQPVSQKEYLRAADLGSSARRAGKSVDLDPFAEDHTDRGYLLSSSWRSAWESENEARARK